MKTEEKTQVSAVGFEPGTFRSCVEHSIHYATETPPIPDVLLVLVAPKHIHRNVTTTLQSRFTQPHPTGHTLELYYFILFFYFILFYFCETSQYLALFTDPVTDLAQKVWTLPIFQHFSSDFLSFNMTDLADNETTIYTTDRQYGGGCSAKRTFQTTGRGFSVFVINEVMKKSHAILVYVTDKDSVLCPHQEAVTDYI